MFVKISAAAAVFMALSAVPAFAQMGCSDPIAPEPVDGSKATTQQMKDAHADVANFLKASDDYQACLINQLKSAKTAAAKQQASNKNAKPFDPALETSTDAKADANQRLKEKVGAEYNAAVAAYKAKHPGG